ncbi:MAG: glycosyltransferase family 9 protein [Candidatus Sericytochromatia bacterium]|nr:glycosyltransferase family 9 protein [Candidatus Sericytochromatia bacterium]
MDARPEAPIRRILAVNFGGLGDAILFFPTLQTLRRHYPHAHITVLCEPRCREIMERQYLVDQVITADVKASADPQLFVQLVMQLRQLDLDLAISSGRSPLVPLLLFLSGAHRRVGFSPNRLGFLLTDRVPLKLRQYTGDMHHDLLKGIGIDEPAPLPRFPLSDLALEWAYAWLERQNLSASPGPIFIHPGASKMSVTRGIEKTWTAPQWQLMLEGLRQRGLPLILAGGPDDEELLAGIPTGAGVVRAKTETLEQLAALIAVSRLVIGSDSAALNIAVAVGTPLVGLFGPSDPDKVLPPDHPEFCAVHVAGLACRPCLWITRQTTCAALTCLNSLGPEPIWAAVDRLLETSALPASIGAAGPVNA